MSSRQYNPRFIIGSNSVNESGFSQKTKCSGERDYNEIEDLINNVIQNDNGNSSMSSNSENNSKSNSLINQEIWTNNIKQDPKKFKERFSALKETKTAPKGNAVQAKGKKIGKMKPIQKMKKNEDYSEDEMDESVTVSMPKNNVRQSTNSNYKEQKVKKIKKPIANNIPSMKPQNNVNGQFYPTQNIPMNMNTMPPQEFNFININIAPGTGRFTQNIYMNFPNANIQPITNVNTNNIMINQPQNYNSYTNNKINLDNIIIGKDKRTTLMLRNIPNKYTLNNIVDEIGCAFWGKYDCINLPIDYETKLNLGYAFINFTDPMHIIHFFSKFHMKKWSRYKSEKKMDMTYADKQGKKDITLKAENNYFPQDDPRFDFKMLKPLIEIPNNYLDFFKKMYPTSVCVTKDKSLYTDGYFYVKSFGKK